MKRRRGTVIGMAFLFCFAAAFASAEGEVVLATNDFPPYVMQGDADFGPISKIIRAAFKEAGVAVTIRFHPWQRAENEVRSGRAFGVFPYRPTEERRREFDFTDPYYAYTARFFYNTRVHPNGIPYRTLEDLKPYKVGAVNDFWYLPLFEKAGLQVNAVPSIDQSLKMLHAGRIDLFPEEENTAWYLIRKLFPGDERLFATLPQAFQEPGVTNKLSLMVSRAYPGSKDLIEKFNAGLAAIRRTGVYRKILEEYRISAAGQ